MNNSLFDPFAPNRTVDPYPGATTRPECTDAPALAARKIERKCKRIIVAAVSRDFDGNRVRVCMYTVEATARVQAATVLEFRPFSRQLIGASQDVCLVRLEYRHAGGPVRIELRDLALDFPEEEGIGRTSALWQQVLNLMAEVGCRRIELHHNRRYVQRSELRDVASRMGWRLESDGFTQLYCR